MYKISSEAGIIPIASEVVEQAANMIRNNNQKKDQPPEIGVENITTSSPDYKAASENDLNPFGKAFEEAEKKSEEPKATKARPSAPHVEKPKMPESFRSKVFSHLTKHKMPYGAGVAAAGLVGGSAWISHLNKKHEDAVKEKMGKS